jgi:hypothetical protein
VATLVAINANEAMVAPVVESAFGGSLESGGRFRVGAFGRNLASVTVKMFPRVHFVLSMRFTKIMLQ